MNTPPITVHRRGEDYDQQLSVSFYWDHNGMLCITQDQKMSAYRTGEDSVPALVFYAEQLPALMAAIKEAAGIGAEFVDEGIQHNRRVFAELRALADEPLPSVTPERPAKKKEGAAP